MALNPVVVIGCGGSGGKVVLGLRRRLQEELKRVDGWKGGLPQAWQLLWIDTPSTREDHPKFGPPLPRGDYLSLVTYGKNYADVDDRLVFAAGQNLDRLIGWRPHHDLPVPVKIGAGQMRAVGRAVACTQPNVIVDGIQRAAGLIAGGAGQLAELSRLLGDAAPPADTDGPIVMVVSSLAGGTGAGIMQDVCDVVRASIPDVSGRIFAYLFTAEVFGQIKSNAGMIPNTVAALSELMSGNMASSRVTELLYPATGPYAASGISGPDYPFLIGLQPLGGGEPLSNAMDAYRAVTETLVAGIMNPQVQADMIQYEIANFVPNSGTNYRRLSWAFGNEPSVEELSPKCGVVSSFGSAQVSVGVARFSEYAVDRLTRSVVDFLTTGWRVRGVEQMPKERRVGASDADVVAFLVSQRGFPFLSAVGLREEDDPDGTEHNEVLEALYPFDELRHAGQSAKAALLKDEARGPGPGWISRLLQLVEQRRGSFIGQCEAVIVERTDAFAGELAQRILMETSGLISEWGQPVALGVIQAARESCQNAVHQLRKDAQEFGRKSQTSALEAVTRELASAARGMVEAGSSFVQAAINQAFGPVANEALSHRCLAAAVLLETVIDRVLAPLDELLESVGKALNDTDFKKDLDDWPDDEGGVPVVYRPSPSEFCLLEWPTWGQLYVDQLKASSGSLVHARTTVGQGGFEFGPPGARDTAKVALSIADDGSSGRWWTPSGGFVKFQSGLGPLAIWERAQQYLTDEGGDFGKFLGQSLSGYLSERDPAGHLIAEHPERLKRFKEALLSAKSMAKPLVHIDTTVMNQVHPGGPLDTTTVIEQFPFGEKHPGRLVVDEVMFGTDPPDGGWFRAGTSSVERVLMVTWLSHPVHPSAIASLTGPIVTKWMEIEKSPLEARSGRIRGFWFNNRARLLTEFVPVVQPVLKWMISGWFVGRLLGLVEPPTETEPIEIGYVDAGVPARASFPWPTLRHGKNPNLQDSPVEWLPAILEHLGLAMMLISHRPAALTAYDKLYQLGRSSRSTLQTWVLQGSTAGALVKPMVTGSTPQERKDALVQRITTLIPQYQTKVLLNPDPAIFYKQTGFGFELESEIAKELQTLLSTVNELATEADIDPNISDPKF